MFNDIFKAISDDSSYVTLLIAALIYFVLLIGSKLVNKLFEKKDNGHLNTTIPISQHDYFQFLNDSYNYKIETFDFESEQKKIVFTVYFKIILKIMHDEWKDFLEDDLLLTYNQSELKSKFTKKYRAVIDKYDSKAMAIGIPNIVIERVRLLHTAQSPEIVEAVGDVIDNPYYTSNYARVHSIFNYYKIITSLTIEKARLGVNDLNGQLEKEIVDLKLLNIIL